ncbi:MAG: terminase family protein [Bryobacteraceae bacterium]
MNALHHLLGDFKTGATPVEFVRERLGFEPDPTQAAVLNSKVLRGILNCCRQWGKSTTTAAKAVHHAFHNPGSLTLVLSPSERQSAEFIRKAATFLQSLNIKPRGDGDNDVSLLLPNRARIIGLPGKEKTIRGFSGVTLLIVDEAARVPDSLYYSLRPTIATCPNASIWLMSTPNGLSGFFHACWTSDREEWYRVSVPATECPRISAGFLEEERRALGERWFAQEYLCQFAEPEAALFANHELAALLDQELPPLGIASFDPLRPPVCSAKSADPDDEPDPYRPLYLPIY